MFKAIFHNNEKLMRLIPHSYLAAMSEKICKDITNSRQMAKAHYPSDIRFGEKLAKSMFDYLKTNDLIH